MRSKISKEIKIIQKLISRIGIKRSIYYLLLRLKLIKLKPNRIIELKSGLKIPLIDNRMYLYYNEYNEKNIVEYIKNVTNFSTFINVGSAYGEYLFFSAINPNIKIIYGFEPIFYFYEIIKKVLKLNPKFAKKIKIRNCTIGDYTGVTKFYLNKGALTSSSLFSSISNIVEDIKIYKIDDLNLKIQPPILMLIDTEGYEIQVLEGARKLIEKYKPSIIMEVWEKNVLKYEKSISKLNYEYNLISKEKNSETEYWKLKYIGK